MYLRICVFVEKRILGVLQYYHSSGFGRQAPSCKWYLLSREKKYILCFILRVPLSSVVLSATRFLQHQHQRKQQNSNTTRQDERFFMSKVKNPFFPVIFYPDGSKLQMLSTMNISTFAIAALSMLSAESNAYKVWITSLFCSFVFFPWSVSHNHDQLLVALFALIASSILIAHY